MNGVKCIDVSHHNGGLDWDALRKNGVAAAIVRVSYGMSGRDRRYEAHLTDALAAGISCGAYHYSYALTPAEAEREADHFLACCAGWPLRLPLFFDMEDADDYKKKHNFRFTRENVTAITRAFVHRVQARGYRCGVYASKYWLEQYIDLNAVGADAVWAAQWAERATYRGRMDLWQYTDRERIAGSPQSVDMSLLYRTDWLRQEKEVEEMKVFESVAEMPLWAQDTFSKLDARGVIAHDEAGKIAVQECTLQTMVYLDRMGLL